MLSNLVVIAYLGENDLFSLNSSEFIRYYLVKNMDIMEKKEISFSFRTMQYLKLNVFLTQDSKQTTNEYWWREGEKSISNSGYLYYGTNKFYFTKTGINFRFIYKEKFMQTMYGRYSRVQITRLYQEISLKGLHGNKDNLTI